LAGSLITNSAMGFLEATYPDRLPPNVGDIMLYPNYEHVADPKMYFHVMEGDGFPPAMLSPRKLCPLSLQNHSGLSNPYAEKEAHPEHGVHIPILRAQAVFIPGGLILSVYWHHSVLEGFAANLYFDPWAGYVKDFKNGFDFDAAASKIVPVDSSAHRLAVDALMSDPKLNGAPRYPLLVVEPDKNPRPSIHSEPYKIVAKIIVLPASSLAALKVELEALAGTRVST
jgi:hypothetical protein